MARWSDESGVPNTCPFIDQAISELNCCECDSVDANKAESALEKVRAYNEELRAWGNEQYRRAEELQLEIDRLEKELDDAICEIQDLKEQCE